MFFSGKTSDHIWPNDTMIHPSRMYQWDRPPGRTRSERSLLTCARVSSDMTVSQRYFNSHLRKDKTKSTCSKWTSSSKITWPLHNIHSCECVSINNVHVYLFVQLCKYILYYNTLPLLKMNVRTKWMCIYIIQQQKQTLPNVSTSETC